MAFDFEAVAEATSGAVGGLLSTTILYPLDTCKTKYQAEVQAGDSRKYRSLFDVLREAIASRQLQSLYQGIATKNLHSVISQFIYFYSYSYFKHLYLQHSKAKHMGASANLIVASAAGTCTAIFTQPLDTASAKMQTSAFGKSKGLWETLTEGTWKEAFDGLGASLVLVSNPAIQYTVFEQLKRKVLERKLRSEKASFLASGGKVSKTSKKRSTPVVLSAFTAFLLGAVSKIVATAVTYPAIRCKVMIQVAENEATSETKNNHEINKRPSKSMLQTFHMIWQREGAAGFYKGLKAQILKTVLGAALMLMIKEKVSQSTWVIMLAIRRSLTGKSNPKLPTSQTRNN